MPAKTEQYIDSCKCARADLTRWRDTFVCVDLTTADVPHEFPASNGIPKRPSLAFRAGWDDPPYGRRCPRAALVEAVDALRLAKHAVAADDIEHRHVELAKRVPELDYDIDGSIGRQFNKRMIAPLLGRLGEPVPATSLTAEKPTNPTVLKAAVFIRKHPGKNADEIAKHLDKMEASSFRTHIAPELRKMGITSTRGCKAGYRDARSRPRREL
jgi:hypothetical protein